MLSEKALDTKPYNDMPKLESYNPYIKQETPKDVPWSKSSIRSWLNTDFLNEAFSSEEKEKIVLTNIQTLTNYERNTTETTDDYVFLLSNEEAKKYFSSDAERKSTSTSYAISRNITEWPDKDNNSFCLWWLRTVGKYEGYEAMLITPRGEIYPGYVQNGQLSKGKSIERIGVRPALWIDIG